MAARSSLPLRLPFRLPLRLATVALLVTATTATTGCAELLAQLSAVGPAAVQPPQPPRVDVANVRLIRSPTDRQLAGWYCTQVAPMLLCQLFGVVPPMSALQFSFDIDLDVHNPNPYPIPMVEILTAFSAWPGAQGQKNLGAVCLSLCDDGQSCSQGDPQACRSGGPDIRTMADFGMATVNFLLGVATGTTGIENLRVRMLPADGTGRVIVHLELGVSAVLDLVRKMAGDAIDVLRKGKQPHFAIPWRVEGTVWLRVEGFGRFGAGFGPRDGVWNLVAK